MVELAGGDRVLALVTEPAPVALAIGQLAGVAFAPSRLMVLQ